MNTGCLWILLFSKSYEAGTCFVCGRRDDEVCTFARVDASVKLTKPKPLLRRAGHRARPSKENIADSLQRTADSGDTHTQAQRHTENCQNTI